jgi:hypothetical protein
MNTEKEQIINELQRTSFLSDKLLLYVKEMQLYNKSNIILDEVDQQKTKLFLNKDTQDLLTSSNSPYFKSTMFKFNNPNQEYINTLNYQKFYKEKYSMQNILNNDISRDIARFSPRVDPRINLLNNCKLSKLNKLNKLNQNLNQEFILAMPQSAKKEYGYRNPFENYFQYQKPLFRDAYASLDNNRLNRAGAATRLSNHCQRDIKK